MACTMDGCQADHTETKGFDSWKQPHIAVAMTQMIAVAMTQLIAVAILHLMLRLV